MSGREIEVAHAQRAGLPPPPEQFASWKEAGMAVEQIAKELEPMPLWRQALMVPGLGSCFAGFVWFKFAFSMRDLGLAIAAMVGGILLVCLGGVGYKRPSERPPG